MPETNNLTPPTLAVGLLLGLLMLALPRRYSLLPLLVAGCYMTLGQALNLGGLHLYMFRILILCGLIRVVVRKEIFQVRLTSIDKILVAWLLVSSFLYLIFDGRYVNLSERLGGFFDALGTYTLVRSSIRGTDDILRVVKACAIIVIPLALLFSFERTTGRNPFAVLGGVRETPDTRDGKIRSQGPFKHPILAGTFGATMMPLFAGLWVATRKRERLLAAAGFVGATTIVMTSGSSGAFSAYFVSVVGLLCWSCRSHMRLIRWGIVSALVALDLVMRAPIWYLIDRFSELVGGDGWYRSALIGAAVYHFNEWWLIGTGFTAHWMETGIPGNPYSADIVNEFINQAIHGGLLCLGLFIWLLVKCFKTTGVAVRREASTIPLHKFMLWSMGCVVVGHVASFFSVAYYDQIIIFWYLIIGMIAVLAHQEMAAAVVTDPAAVMPIRPVHQFTPRRAVLAPARTPRPGIPARPAVRGRP